MITRFDHCFSLFGHRFIKHADRLESTKDAKELLRLSRELLYNFLNFPSKCISMSAQLLFHNVFNTVVWMMIFHNSDF